MEFLKIEIIILKVRKAIKNMQQPNKKYKTPNFTFNGQIGNRTMNNTNIITKIKYTTGLLLFSTEILKR
jgi:hypothetical protein